MAVTNTGYDKVWYASSDVTACYQLWFFMKLIRTIAYQTDRCIVVGCITL